MYIIRIIQLGETAKFELSTRQPIVYFIQSTFCCGLHFVIHSRGFPNNIWAVKGCKNPRSSVFLLKPVFACNYHYNHEEREREHIYCMCIFLHLISARKLFTTKLNIFFHTQQLCTRLHHCSLTIQPCQVDVSPPIDVAKRFVSAHRSSLS